MCPEHMVAAVVTVVVSGSGTSSGCSGSSSFSDLVACQRPCRLSAFLLCRSSGSNSGNSMGASGNDIVRGSSSLGSRNTAVVPAAVPVET
jgi:hypothetical protein